MNRSRRLAVFGWLAAILCLGACADRSADDDTGPPSADTASTDLETRPDTGPADDTETPPPDTWAPDIGDTSTEDIRDTKGASDTRADTSPDCTADQDNDGLTDCEEDTLCTDPMNPDSDGDRLGDGDEIGRGTDPCSNDTDGDGVDDGEEDELELDPTKKSTYDDGKTDGDRWIVDACDDPKGELVEYSSHRRGTWALAVPSEFTTPTKLTIANAPSTWDAASVYDAATLEASAFTLTREAVDTKPSPVALLNDTVDPAVRSLGTVGFHELGSSFRTHDGFDAATGSFEVTVGTKTKPSSLRRKLLAKLAAFGSSDVQNWPTINANKYREFRVDISVVVRDHTLSNTKTTLFSAAVAPVSQVDSDASTRRVLHDVTNTTHVSDQIKDPEPGCTRLKPSTQSPKAEYYWVVDGSSSMTEEVKEIRSFASEFHKRLRNSRVDYRFGVTNSDISQQGRIDNPPGWFTGGMQLDQEIGDHVGCAPSSSGSACAWTEKGLEAAGVGLTYMLGHRGRTPTPAEAIRSNAPVIAIFVSDEAAQGDTTPAERVFGRNHDVRAFAVVPPANQPNCQVGPNAPVGKYRDIAQASGGTYADLCSTDLKENLRRIADAGAAASSQFRLGDGAISSTLRVYKNGNWIPRSREDGYWYYPERNVIAFFGDYRPAPSRPGRSPDRIAVHYQKWYFPCGTSPSPCTSL